MARLFIAEKPELGRAIAKGLSGSVTEQNNTYIKKGGDIVTWAFGHILELKKPDDYDEKYKKWNLADLPFDIKNFEYKPLEKSEAQLKVILNLLKDKSVSEVVHCGDADDEGQILIEEILAYAKNLLPVKRLLINDISDAGIAKELQNIRDNKEFQGLANRGFARSLADWIVGLNLTRAYTVQAQSKGFQGILNLGRVQTPILGLVVNRDYEHENFKSASYFAISGNFIADNISFRANLKIDERLESQEIAYQIVKDCENMIGKVVSVKIENKKENPPLPYNLLKLQAECAKCFGLKPDEVLKITQNLRENHHAITYNRSDCEYLPETLYHEAPQIIENLKSKFGGSTLEILNDCDLAIKGVTFNDKNITAHHGIIPTTSSDIDLSKMNENERKIFTMITERFALQFYPQREYQAISIELNIKDNIFVANSTNDLKLGFTTKKHILLNRQDSRDKNEEWEEQKELENQVSQNIGLQNLKKNTEVNCTEIKAEAKKTKPKPYYTMATLLTDLTGVAKYAKDPKIKKLLLEKDSGKKGENGGIGTPATRSTHIKKLIDGEYISVSNDKKQIIHATQKGKDLIAIAPEILTGIDMTALWFEKQKDIENGELSLDDFIAEINAQIKNEIEKVKQKQMDSFKNGSLILCPVCKQGHLVRAESKKTKGVYYWYCSEYKSGCDKTFWDENGKPDFEPKPKQEISNNVPLCPKCKKGKILQKTSKVGNTYFQCVGGKDKKGNWCNALFNKNDDGTFSEFKIK